MPSTHLSLHYHLIFSTKNRLPFIEKEWRANLHAYLGGIVKGINGVPLAVGGIEDHVHLLIGFRATHRLDYVLRDIKADSSNWVHNVVGRNKFEWQKGYLGLTVSPSQIERVKLYVLNQEEHHRRQSFKEEYLELLKLARSNTTSGMFGERILCRPFRARKFTRMVPEAAAASGYLLPRLRRWLNHSI